MFKKIKTNLISILFSFLVVDDVVFWGGPFFYSLFWICFPLLFFFTFFSSLSVLFSYSDFSVPLKTFWSISEWFMDDFPDKCAGHTAVWMSNFGMTSVYWPHCSMNEQLWDDISILATLQYEWATLGWHQYTGHTAVWMSNFGMTSVYWPHCSMNEQLWDDISILATLQYEWATLKWHQYAGHTAVWMSNFNMTSVYWPHCSMNEQL